MMRPKEKNRGSGQVHHKKWRLNDLQRRQLFLCNFIQASCDGKDVSRPITLDLNSHISFIPFAKGAY